VMFVGDISFPEFQDALEVISLMRQVRDGDSHSSVREHPSFLPHRRPIDAKLLLYTIRTRRGASSPIGDYQSWPVQDCVGA